MPIIRKVIAFGDSKAVTLPKSWLREIEQRTGQVITELALEVNGAITVRPVFDMEKEKNGSTDTSKAETL